MNHIWFIGCVTNGWYMGLRWFTHGSHMSHKSVTHIKFPHWCPLHPLPKKSKKSFYSTGVTNRVFLRSNSNWKSIGWILCLYEQSVWKPKNLPHGKSVGDNLLPKWSIAWQGWCLVRECAKERPKRTNSGIQNEDGVVRMCIV